MVVGAAYVTSIGARHQTLILVALVREGESGSSKLRGTGLGHKASEQAFRGPGRRKGGAAVVPAIHREQKPHRNRRGLPCQAKTQAR